jgi:hypothetical protein
MSDETKPLPWGECRCETYPCAHTVQSTVTGGTTAAGTTYHKSMSTILANKERRIRTLEARVAELTKALTGLAMWQDTKTLEWCWCDLQAVESERHLEFCLAARAALRRSPTDAPGAEGREGDS